MRLLKKKEKKREHKDRQAEEAAVVVEDSAVAEVTEVMLAVSETEEPEFTREEILEPQEEVASEEVAVVSVLNNR